MTQIFAFQPDGHGQLSFFVVADDEAGAFHVVSQEIGRRLSLPHGTADRIDSYDVQGWGTDYYVVSAVQPGVVITNGND